MHSESATEVETAVVIANNQIEWIRLSRSDDPHQSPLIENVFSRVHAAFQPLLAQRF
jgi:hypothetical protein